MVCFPFTGVHKFCSNPRWNDALIKPPLIICKSTYLILEGGCVLMSLYHFSSSYKMPLKAGMICLDLNFRLHIIILKKSGRNWNITFIVQTLKIIKYMAPHLFLLNYLLSTIVDYLEKFCLDNCIPHNMQNITVLITYPWTFLLAKEFNFSLKHTSQVIEGCASMKGQTG